MINTDACYRLRQRTSDNGHPCLFATLNDSAHNQCIHAKLCRRLVDAKLRGQERVLRERLVSRSRGWGTLQRVAPASANASDAVGAMSAVLRLYCSPQSSLSRASTSSALRSVQREIATAISGNLRVRLTTKDKSRLAKSSATNPETYQLYLKGRYHAYQTTASELNKSIDYFRQAIEKASFEESVGESRK